ncbi:hypothetical protein [Nannocystis pusilla]|uniref:hypothetical protein n=1 Tax=Nannocystis pusilla TaxID=889268 RepID=UPI003B77D9ED
MLLVEDDRDDYLLTSELLEELGEGPTTCGGSIATRTASRRCCPAGPTCACSTTASARRPASSCCARWSRAAARSPSSC